MRPSLACGLVPFLARGNLGEWFRASVPEYPELMYPSGIEGKFVLNLTVSPPGEVSNAVVVESPGRFFDPQITAHLKRWRF
jgi:TonB family protein